MVMVLYSGFMQYASFWTQVLHEMHGVTDSLMLIITCFQVQHREQDNVIGDTKSSLNIPVKLKIFVELTMDVASASPRRYFFEVR